MVRAFLVCCIILTSLVSLHAQKSFSEDQDEFYRQVINNLRALNTEPARKVAFDFNNAWTGKFTNAQKEKIHEIALTMQKKGYSFKPYYWYYFSYLAFADAQAHLDRDEISHVLEINEKMVGSLEKGDYRNFLLGLNTFMARRILYRTKNLLAITDNGSFDFKVIDYVEPEPQEEIYEDPVEEEPVEEIIEESQPVSDDPWGDDTDDDPWGDNSDDPWGDSSDPWGDNDDDPWGDESDDPWGDDSGSYQDNWVDSEDTWGYDATGEVYEEKAERQFVEAIAQDYVANMKAKYRHPELEGPAIDLENNSLLIITPYDSFRIKETDATFLLKTRMLAGENAIINWPLDNKKAQGAVVNLGQYYIRPDRADFWSPHATLTFPKMFAGSVDGVFEFRSQRRKKNTLSNYPIFTSNEANINLNLPGEKLSYIGGLQITGNRFVGTAVSRNRGKLEILDGRGNKVIFRAVRYLFREDSSIVSADARMTILHDGDSLYHPSVQMRYDAKKNELFAMRTKDFNVTPFYSTYFNVNINAQTVTWNMENDSVNFSIMNGKDLIPVTIESEDFFNIERFNRLGASLAFHPVVTSVFYANKFNTRVFADQEIADHFKVSIKQVKGAMRVLEEYGFATYNHETGLVELKDKAFLYYQASAQQVDYDNIMIPSLEPGQPNAIWRLDSGDMKVNGVKRFYMTSDFEVYIEPDSSQMTLLEGRNMLVDGMINAGDFQYRGKNYMFDYDEFLVKLNKIDSIRIQVDSPDSILAEGGPEKLSLKNHLNQTSGTIYLNSPDNKSGVKTTGEYPDFISESDAIVYFDGEEILNGAYDKSVKFLIPPFEMDSINNREAMSFDGRFNSGGIFPTFEETLKVMPDQSLGFVHQIPEEGYQLYGTPARTYEKITLSNKGMRGGGKIDFITSTIYSDDFVYYPDSVAAIGTGGFIGPGEVRGASYPEAILGPYRMHWLPRIDSMYLQNLIEPFKFYNSTAEVEGEINITSKGVFGSGTMNTRGSRAVSKELTFKQYSYSARHADFEVLTDNPEKPAMAGDDIRLNFDLKRNIAEVSPEKIGVAAISFPYAQMNTSITNAIWDLEDSVVTMTKPDNIPIEDSYFYTTREDLDSLVFNAEQAVYDFNSRELNIKGIPFIIVADAKIIPENNETTILENSELQSFNHAEVIIDTLNGYHYLKNGEIKIISRNEFIGTAMYQLVTGTDTFGIKFDRFVLQEVYNEDDEPVLMTVSGGEVLEKDKVRIAPGFNYKGQATMYADKKALDLEGSVQLILQDPTYNYWIRYVRDGDDPFVKIDIDTALFEDDEPVIAGLHYDLRGDLYSTFAEQRDNSSDEDFFLAKGILSYDTLYKNYRIENPAKSAGESYQGHTYIYDDSTKNIIFEGKAQFFSPYSTNVTVDASILGTGNRERKEFNIDAFLGINFTDGDSYMDIMAEDLLDIIERLGPPLANDISVELLYKLANYTSDKSAKSYEESSLKDYEPLYDVSDNMEKSLIVSGVKMSWSESQRAWYNTTKLGISNIYKEDVNAKLDGFIEMKKDESNNDVLNLFIQAAPGTWYFISYASNTLLMYSSNSEFNDEINARSNFGKAKPGEMVLVGGDENETLSFINEFRKNYFGITEPYDLVYPEEINLEDESFDTIEEEEDDGFGF